MPPSPNNPFMNFLQEYRKQVSKGRQQSLVSREASNIWRQMSDEQKACYYAQQNRNASENLSGREGSNYSMERPRARNSMSPTPGTSSVRQSPYLMCNRSDCRTTNSPESRRSNTESPELNWDGAGMEPLVQKCARTRRGHRAADNPATSQLIECLLCECENGHYARGMLFQGFEQADGTVLFFYKVLIFTLLATLCLSVWHFYQ